MFFGILIGAVTATVFWMYRIPKLQALGVAVKGLFKKAHDAADDIRKA